MKILVTGSNGMMGWGIKKVFKEHDLILTDKHNLDVTNIDQVKKFVYCKADIIIHLAAETDHYRAEMNPKNTYFINQTGTTNMVFLANTISAKLVYVGTCGIFNGTKSSYVEIDSACPLNHYGRSKWYGETETFKIKNTHLVARSGWAMGGGPNIDKKFVNLIYRQISNGAKMIYAIADVYGTPTYTPYFAEFIRDNIDDGIYGIRHYTGNKASRYDVAKEFVRLMGVGVEVIPVTYDEYHNKFGLKVPYTKCEVLSTIYVSPYKYRDWQEGLAEYVNECFK